MNDWRPFVYGGLASVTAECGTFPIDTTKTRLQIQGQHIDAVHKELKYRGMSHAAIRICREEGICALYSGLAPAVLRQATYGTIKIGIYHSLKRVISPSVQEEKLWSNVVCGIIAGVVSSSIANPTDVLKIRMQAQNVHFAKQGMVKSFADIFHKEGVQGLWRGVGPTSNRAAVVCGVELPAYDIVKRQLIHSGILEDSRTTHFLSSFFAGLVGAIASNPIDVVKTRLMNQRNLKTAVFADGTAAPAIYHGSLHCLVQTYKTEGFLALYKGFIPNWVRLGPWSVIFFMTFEQMKKMY